MPIQVECGEAIRGITELDKKCIKLRESNKIVYENLMSEFGMKGSISNEDLMIHVLKSLPEDHDVIMEV